ncbi:MAG: PfkB family carbohydrate kinase [Candidatus Zixiibacteriota bacterium]
MSIVVVGSVAMDTIETPAGKIECGLGGSATHFSLAASKFTSPRIVGIIGDDFPQDHLNMLAENNIDIDGIKRVPGKTFQWSGVYGDDFGDPETLMTELGVFETFSPEIPDKYQDSPVLFLANIAPSLQYDVVQKMPNVKFIGADTMNFWIEGVRDDLLRLIAEVDLLVINELEVRLLSGKENFLEGARDVLDMGPNVLIAKRGANGSALITANDYFMMHAYPVTRLTDPTGAGDSFAGGMMGYLAEIGKYDIDNLKKAMAYGTITASYGVGEFCTGALENTSREIIDNRVEELRKMTQWNW